jgi:hypothetical protein
MSEMSCTLALIINNSSLVCDLIIRLNHVNVSVMSYSDQ